MTTPSDPAQNGTLFSFLFQDFLMNKLHFEYRPKQKQLQEILIFKSISELIHLFPR